MEIFIGILLLCLLRLLERVDTSNKEQADNRRIWAKNRIRKY